MDQPELELVAYHGSTKPAMPIVPASRKREWMSGTGSFANRCLPMVVANESGWVLLNTHAFTACWDGGDRAEAVTVEYEGGIAPPKPPAITHFGLGVLTWNVPYLFRTPPGWNLHVRGPANAPKDGISPLEGIVETDWSVATFTMNWKLTRPGHPVSFGVDEPFCMVVPQRRHELESFRPATRSLKQNPELADATKRWASGRHEEQLKKFLAEHVPGREVDSRSWQKHYFKGFGPDGQAAPEHQDRIALAEFEDGAGDGHG